MLRDDRGKEGMLSVERWEDGGGKEGMRDDGGGKEWLVLRDDEDGGGKEGMSDEDEARKAQC